MIVVAGLQRTGTNYLAETIARHFGVPVSTTPFWKHLSPRERTQDGTAVTEILDARPTMRVAVIVKHPVMWLESILHRKSMGIFTRRPGQLDGEGEALIGQLGELYGTYYEDWLDRAGIDPRVRLVRYEDVLAGDFACLAEALGPLAPPELPAQAYAVPLVQESKLFTDLDRARYLRRESALPDRQVSIFRAALSPRIAALYDAPSREAARGPEQEAARADAAAALDAERALQRIRSAVEDRDKTALDAERRECVALVQTVREHYSRDPAALYLAGRFCQIKGMKPRGITLLRRALAVTEKLSGEPTAAGRLLVFRASVHEALGEHAEVRDALLQVVELKPREWAHRLRLATALLHLKEEDAAREQLRLAEASGAPAERCAQLLARAGQAMATQS